MRRQQLDAAVGQRPQLHARAEQLLADDALLDDAAVRLELRHVASREIVGASSCISRTRAAIAARRSATGSSAMPARSTSALPAPDTPSLSLTITWRIEGRAVRSTSIASTTSSRLCRFSAPSGWGTPTSAKSRRQPLLVPSAARPGSAPYIGMPRLRARSRSSSVVLYGMRWLRVAVGDQRRDPREQPRPLEQLLAQRLGEESSTESSENRASAWLGNDTGQEREVVLDDPRVDAASR